MEGVATYIIDATKRWNALFFGKTSLDDAKGETVVISPTLVMQQLYEEQYLKPGMSNHQVHTKICKDLNKMSYMEHRRWYPEMRETRETTAVRERMMNLAAVLLMMDDLLYEPDLKDNNILVRMPRTGIFSVWL